MKTNDYLIIFLLLLITLIFIGFQYCYNLGFGKGVMSVCGNLTAYTKDNGKSFYCDKKIENNIYLNNNNYINLSNWSIK